MWLFKSVVADHCYWVSKWPMRTFPNTPPPPQSPYNIFLNKIIDSKPSFLTQCIIIQCSKPLFCSLIFIKLIASPLIYQPFHVVASWDHTWSIFDTNNEIVQGISGMLMASWALFCFLIVNVIRIIKSRYPLRVQRN